MSPVCQLQMTLRAGFPGGVGVDGTSDERWRAAARPAARREPELKIRLAKSACFARQPSAHSGEDDQPFRPNVITDSGDRDHADHGRQKPGVMVAALHAADISVGCMGMVGPVKSAADRPRSRWRGPRAPRSALASDGAACAGRRCGPPWAIGPRAVMQRGSRRRQVVGARTGLSVRSDGRDERCGRGSRHRAWGRRSPRAIY